MTKAQLKYVQLLKQQKYRKAHKCYLVEGEKNVKEWLAGPSDIPQLFATEKWLEAHHDLLSRRPDTEVVSVRDFEMEKLSALASPAEVLLIARMPPPPPPPDLRGSWSIYLDGVRDPGNMGTLFRIADWFGIPFLFCSPDCVEPYNPKVVQASMGSLLRVPFVEMDAGGLRAVLTERPQPVYVTAMQGENVFSLLQPEPGILVLGNESQGVRPPLLDLATRTLSIPGKGGAAESLNVAVAGGILAAVLNQQGGHR